MIELFLAFVSTTLGVAGLAAGGMAALAVYVPRYAPHLVVVALTLGGSAYVAHIQLSLAATRLDLTDARAAADREHLTRSTVTTALVRERMTYERRVAKLRSIRESIASAPEVFLQIRIGTLVLVAVLAACGPDPRTLDPSTAIPDELLTCAERPARDVKSQQELSDLLVDYDDAHGDCRSKLEAVRGVLRPAKGGSQ